MPKVWNKYHKGVPKSAVYIGRGSSFGNPYVIGKDGDRDEVCDKFIELVESTDGLKEDLKSELKGKDLVCFCKPHRCHGDYLLKIAND